MVVYSVRYPWICSWISPWIRLWMYAYAHIHEYMCGVCRGVSISSSFGNWRLWQFLQKMDSQRLSGYLAASYLPGGVNFRSAVVLL